MEIVKKQIEYEYTAWQKSLDLFKQENSFLKYRLSEIVDNNEDDYFIQMAEYFQNELLQKDEMLQKLNRELQELSNTVKTIPDQSASSEGLVKAQNSLRKDILQFEKEFQILSHEFNEKMQGSL